jgi:hypothetical protein
MLPNVAKTPCVLPSLASRSTGFTPCEIRDMVLGDPPIFRSARADHRFMIHLSDLLTTQAICVSILTSRPSASNPMNGECR